MTAVNTYSLILVLTGLCGVALWLWGDCQRLRADRADSERSQERAHAHDLAIQLRIAKRTLRRLRVQRDHECAAIERIRDEIVAVDDRNRWLEARRNVVLSRWWRRAKYRHLAGRLIVRQSGPHLP